MITMSPSNFGRINTRPNKSLFGSEHNFQLSSLLSNLYHQLQLSPRPFKYPYFVFSICPHLFSMSSPVIRRHSTKPKIFGPGMFLFKCDSRCCLNHLFHQQSLIIHCYIVDCLTLTIHVTWTVL